MQANTAYPIYTTVLVAANGTKYKVQNATIDLSLTESENELAQKVTLSLINVAVGSGYLLGCITPGMRCFVYANDGSKTEEVFRGVVWERNYQRADSKEIKISAYDNLIYTQKSKDCIYFSSGKSTKSIVQSICDRWGIKLSYGYSSITHPKLPLNNKNISDMFIEVLDEVKKKKGTKYVIRSVKDVIQIKSIGSNTNIYSFKSGSGAIQTKSNVTLDGVITKVIITGKQDDNDKVPIEATIKSANTSKYGTLQDIVNRDSDTTLADAKNEAKELIKENEKAKETYSLSAPDIPWVHKGDKVKISAGDLSGSYYVVSMQHNAANKTMSMDVKII